MIMQFKKHRFNSKKRYLLDKVKEILKEFAAKDIRVTLRQLHYQLVSRDLILNKKSEYDKLSTLLTDARYAGEVDWDAIEDRIRVPNIPNTFKDIPELMRAAANSYALDRWETQSYYIELWTEKDAISSVISPITESYQVPVSVNRGYCSATAMYESAKRFLEHEGKTCIILYLGDHDPSGLDMDRDIKKRLEEFGIVNIQIIRIGLTYEQIQKYNLPENQLKKDKDDTEKLSDPRGNKYYEKFGDRSWEVDALNPEVLQKLIENNIRSYLDIEAYEHIKAKEEEDIAKLKGEGYNHEGE